MFVVKSDASYLSIPLAFVNRLPDYITQAKDGALCANAVLYVGGNEDDCKYDQTETIQSRHLVFCFFSEIPALFRSPTYVCELGLSGSPQ